jgi:hypothetical protein
MTLLGVVACACSSAPEPVAPEVVVPAEMRPPSAGGRAVELPTIEEELASQPADSGGVPIRPGFKATPPSQPVIPKIGFGGCLRSPLCRLEGLCSPQAGGALCIAADDDDCNGSDACLGGRCTARDGGCIAGSDEDCRESWACKGWGRCAHDGDESCIAVSLADCRASTRCRREGECLLHGDECAKGP